MDRVRDFCVSNDLNVPPIAVTMAILVIVRMNLRSQPIGTLAVGEGADEAKTKLSDAARIIAMSPNAGRHRINATIHRSSGARIAQAPDTIKIEPTIGKQRVPNHRALLQETRHAAK